MNTNQILDNDALASGLSLTPEIRNHLSETARWGKFLAIVGFVSIGLAAVGIIVMGLFMGVAATEFTESSYGAFAGIFVIILYAIILALYFFPCLYLYRFAIQMQAALTKEDNNKLGEAFKNMKLVYSFLGIMTAIVLGLYAISFVLSLFGGLFAAF